MINWAYFPKNIEIDDLSRKIVEIFQYKEDDISSEKFTFESNKVLEIVSAGLEGIGFAVEKSKKKSDKINVPVLFGINGKSQLSFDADGYRKDIGRQGHKPEKQISPPQQGQTGNIPTQKRNITAGCS